MAVSGNPLAREVVDPGALQNTENNFPEFRKISNSKSRVSQYHVFWHTHPGPQAHPWILSGDDITFAVILKRNTPQLAARVRRRRFTVEGVNCISPKRI